MIIDCPDCLSKYNDETVNKCPACSLAVKKPKKKIYKGKKQIKFEETRRSIREFRDGTINEYKRVSNMSGRRGSLFPGRGKNKLE